MKMCAWLLVVSIALFLFAGTEAQADLPTRELVDSEFVRGDPHEPERLLDDLSERLPYDDGGVAGDRRGAQTWPSSVVRAVVVRLHWTSWAPTLLFSMF